MGNVEGTNLDFEGTDLDVKGVIYGFILRRSGKKGYVRVAATLFNTSFWDPSHVQDSVFSLGRIFGFKLRFTTKVQAFGHL